MVVKQNLASVLVPAASRVLFPQITAVVAPMATSVKLECAALRVAGVVRVQTTVEQDASPIMVLAVPTLQAPVLLSDLVPPVVRAQTALADPITMITFARLVNAARRQDTAVRLLIIAPRQIVCWDMALATPTLSPRARILRV